MALVMPGGNWIRETIYPIFVDNMVALGIEVEVIILDWSTFLTVVYDQHEFDLALAGWATDVNDDTGFDDPWNVFVTGTWANAGQYSNPVADALANQATAAPTRVEKIPLVSEHQVVVMNDLAVLPLVQHCGWPDSDCDGVTDTVDACQIENALGFDADNNGCLDTLQGLIQIIETLPPDVLAPQLKNSLVAKVEAALQSVDHGVDQAAVNELNAFIHQVEAQRGKKISLEAADLLVNYAQNLIDVIQSGYVIP
jgi:hypothetical protein